MARIILPLLPLTGSTVSAWWVRDSADESDRSP